MEQQTALFLRFGVALAIGILVGMQREFAYDQDNQSDEATFAGIRTFALMALSGCTAAYLADLLGSAWAFIAIVLPLGALITVAYFVQSWRGQIGMTTEVAAVVTILAGALCFYDQLALAVAVGVITTVLLSLKFELHGIVARFTREDILAVLKFAIITAIILPVLPNRTFGSPPLDVLNPYKIWLMVVLISGISFLGYILYKFLGSRRGVGLTGLLGGLASSTATTLSFAGRSKKGSHLAKPFALAITIAWTVMFARVLIEVGVVYSPLLSHLWVPMAAAGIVGLVFIGYLYFAPRADDQEEVTISNPFELRPAITFGLLYGLILVVARAAQLYFSETGIYLSSIVSGVADVDAITLSMAELSRSGNLELPTAARAIILAVMANTLVKGAIVVSTGSIQLRRTMIPGILAILAAGITMAILI